MNYKDNNQNQDGPEFVQGIYANQYQDWLFTLSFKKAQWTQMYELLKKEFENEDYIKIEMKKGKKGWYFKKQNKKEIKAQDHSPDREVTHPFD